MPFLSYVDKWGSSNQLTVNLLIYQWVIVRCTLSPLFFLKKSPSPASFSFIFVFSKKHYNFTTNKCEKCPSSLRCWDLNPQPFEHESPPIITRPGLPPLSPFVVNYIITNGPSFHSTKELHGSTDFKVQPQGTFFSSKTKIWNEREETVKEQGSEVNDVTTKRSFSGEMLDVKSGSGDSLVKSQATELRPAQSEDSRKPENDNSDQILSITHRDNYDVKQQGTDGKTLGTNNIKLF